MMKLIFLCFGTASFSLFLDMCMEDGMIFSWYYRLIERVFFKKHIWLFKVLGGCVYCFSTWVFVLFFFWMRSETKLVELFLGIGINYGFIKLYERK